MQCAVAGCSNDSLKISASGKITFHAIPTDVKLKEKWLKIIHLTKRHGSIYVCSLHFDYDDFLPSGELRNDAVPELLQTTSIPWKLCWECASRMLTSSRLRAKAIHTHKLLMGIATSQQYLGTSSILNIDRHKNNLTSTLTKTAVLHITSQDNDVSLDSTIDVDGDTPEHNTDNLHEQENDLSLDKNSKMDTPRHNVKDLDTTLQEKDTSLYTMSKMDTHNDSNLDSILQEKHLSLGNKNEMKLDTHKRNSHDLTIDEDTCSDCCLNSAVDLGMDIKLDDDVCHNDNSIALSDYEAELNNEILNIDTDNDDNVTYEIVSDHSETEKPHSENIFIETNSSIIVPAEFEMRNKKSGYLKKLEPKKRGRKKIEEEPKISKRKPYGHMKRYLFTYEQLSSEEQYQAVRNRKESANFRNGKYKCLLCFKGFQDIDVYTTHKNRHSDLEGTLECDMCKLRYKEKRNLIDHIRTHKDKFTCKKCPFVTSNRSSAASHVTYHKGKVYSCSQCNVQFEHLSTYLGHVRIQHSSEVVCELCGYPFINKKGVQVHKSFKHRFDEQTIPPDAPLCETCDIRFLNDDALQRHLSMSSKHKIDLSATTDAPITCEQCGQTLGNEKLYHEHFTREHPHKNRTIYQSNRNVYMCDICGKIFRNMGCLRQHMTSHTDDYPSCDLCDKKFRLKRYLQKHMKRHQDRSEKRFECAECGMEFNTRFKLERHILSHSTKKQFKCKHCKATFKNLSDRQQHMSFFHTKKQLPKKNSSIRQLVKRKEEASEDEDEDEYLIVIV